MERKLKILKAVLLLRRFNRHETKEKQIAMADKYYSDREIDEWIEYLKNPEPETEFEEEQECIDLEEQYTPSCTHTIIPRQIHGMRQECVSATLFNM